MTDGASNPRQAAILTLDRLRQSGHVAYLAGGCVRDALLGQVPKDYDVATDAPPHVVQKLFKRTAAVGAAFGVVLVYIPQARPAKGRHTIEVATFRAETGYGDGRRPDTVRFTNAQEDAQRRDFTINGLFADPIPTEPGQAAEHAADPASATNPTSSIEDRIIDYVGGRADLEAGIIRAIGDPAKRLGEDYLRMLRAVRFAARLGFEIEPQTANAIRTHAPKLDHIARERIGDEVRRMLMGPNPARAADLLNDLDLHRVILPHTSWSAQAKAVLQGLPESSDYATRLNAWLWTQDPGQTTARLELARTSLMLSNEEYAHAKQTLTLCQFFIAAWEDATPAKRKRMAASPRYEAAIQLIGQSCPARAKQVAEDTQALADDGVGLAPPPLLTGDDLIALGLRPGPEFKTLLEDVYDRQLERRVVTRDDAVAWVRSQSPPA